MNVHSVSLKGLREQNEDKHDIFLNSNNKDCRFNNINYFAVFDGHGGKEVSTYLKDSIRPLFLDKRVPYPLSKGYLINAVDHIQRTLRNKSFAYHCGSTCLLVIHFKSNGLNYINVINSGDSRCVLCRDNTAIPLSKDHKPHWPEEKHRIEQLGGNIRYDGYDWRIKDLSVSRAFGDLDAMPYVTHRPDLYRYRLDKSDKFIVLACDGLWDVMSNSEVMNYVLLNCYDGSTTKRINKNLNIAESLAKYAIKKGSTDNITVIVIFLR